MATKEFGSMGRDVNDMFSEVRALADGAKFPLSLSIQNGRLIHASYETEWKEGTTTPVETGEIDTAGSPIIEYKENYTKRKLKADQIKAIDAWIEKNLEA